MSLRKIKHSRRRCLDQQKLRTRERKLMKINQPLKVRGGELRKNRIGMMISGLMLTELAGTSAE
eukprot:10371097-Karenia_brevis.AAC.1